MALGNPLLPDLEQGYTGLHGASVDPGLVLGFNGDDQGRMQHTALETIAASTVHTYKLNVLETDGNDGFVLNLGGASTGIISGSDSVGERNGTITSTASPTQTISLTGDAVTARVKLQVWPGTI